MLSKNYRLPIGEFIGKRGREVRSAFFILKSFKAEKPHSRLGVIVSKRVFSRAVLRNHLRRRLFEFFRTHEQKIARSDFLLIALSKAAKLGEEELTAELQKIFLP